MNTPLPDDLTLLLDALVESARETLAQGKQVPPTWFLINREIGSMMPLVMPFRDDNEKRAAANLVRATIKRAGCDCVVFVCEGWAKSMNRDDPNWDRINRTGNVRDEAGRIDVLMINVETYDGFWGAMPEVSEKGHRRELAPVEYKPSEQMGAMSNFLPPKPGTVSH